jgi:hypothetical protein
MLEKKTHMFLQAAHVECLRNFLDIARDYLGLGEPALPGDEPTSGQSST